LKAVVDSPKHPNSFGVVISPETAQRLGIPVVPKVVLITGTSATASQQDALNAYLQSHGTAVQPTGYVVVETGPTQFAGVFAWLILAISGLITLGASAIALGLARIDGRRDEFIIGAVGAPPSTLRGIAFWQGIVLAGLGSLIGTAVSLVPAYALSLSAFAFAPPWPQLAATAVGVPLLIAAVTAITRRTRRPLLLGRNAID
jgi:putative ABC transport system permease protein